MHKSTFESAKKICRTLRGNQTITETILWNKLRHRQLDGKKFLRQHPLFFIHPSGKESFYIADFFCHELHLVIEIDGKIHFYQLAYDEARTDILQGMGLTVIRFRNEEIENDLESVLKRIKQMVLAYSQQ